MRTYISSCFPGILSVTVVTCLAFFMHDAGLSLGLGPLSIAVVLGMACRPLLPAESYREVGEVAMVHIFLRFGLVCLGATVSLADTSLIGPSGVLVVILCLSVTLLVTLWLGHRMGLDPRLAALIALGTSVCGASAIAAGRDVIKASPEHTACAVTLVMVLGLFGMFALPVVSEWIGLSPSEAGLWCGVALHEVAQAVAASWQVGPEGGASGTLAKLMRVMLLVPALFVVIFFHRKGEQETDVPFALPWFIVAFTVLCGLRTFDFLSEQFVDFMGFLGTVFLTAGMSALGLRTDLRHIHRLGVAPLVLGVVVWSGLVLFALALILLIVR